VAHGHPDAFESDEDCRTVPRYRTEQLNRTQMKMAGSGMDGGAIMALDNQGRNPMPTEKHRSRETDQAAADD
jgi:hypothetical protein